MGSTLLLVRKNRNMNLSGDFMNNLKINFVNCRGIERLEYDFDFAKSRTYAVYASNGLMKSSFANTFLDFSENKSPHDLIFPSRISKCRIQGDGVDLQAENVFVIKSYDQYFRTDKLSTLMVNGELKEKYDKIYAVIEDKKTALLRTLSKLSGLRAGIEEEISRVFHGEDGKFLSVISDVENTIGNGVDSEFSDISYKALFNDKTIGFLDMKDFQRKIAEYIQKYDELVSASKYFKKGVFSHNNATVVAKNLNDNGFFEAQHSISLNAESDSREIKTGQELELVIQQEKETILNNPDLLKRFEEIDKVLQSHVDLRAFRQYLLDHIKIIPELGDIVGFQRRMWVDYMKVTGSGYNELLDVYNNGKKEMGDIVEAAKKERTRWMSVVKEFNNRFIVPFRLKVENQEEVILRQEVPVLKFLFKESRGGVEVEAAVNEDQLWRTLSSGELKALYLLNVIFEIESRRARGGQSLLVIDDIADSFDYKNKYAIVEYLKDIAEDPAFCQIILTHNFDFFRTIEGRGVVPYDYCLFVERSTNGITLEKEFCIKNPFINNWKLHLDDDRKLVASVSFVRNLIEYIRGNDDADFQKLSSLLHIKSDSSSITKDDLQTIYNDVFPKLNLTLQDSSKSMLELISSTAEECCSSSERFNLEDKVVLAMGIRLKAEEFILSKVTDKNEADHRQTSVLIKRFIDEFGGKDSGLENTITILKRVNLMTPENIHLNAFMYEPILDMSSDQLKKLYNEVKQLQAQPITV
jgi:hypothetical protein